MAIRALNGQHDWTFGMGKNSYLQDEKEIAENLETRVLSFLGDCFFATDEGIDWFNLLGSLNKQTEIEYKVQEVIKNTPGVVGINSVDAVLSQRSIATTTRVPIDFNYSNIGLNMVGSISGNNAGLITGFNNSDYVYFIDLASQLSAAGNWSFKLPALKLYLPFGFNTKNGLTENIAGFSSRSKKAWGVFINKDNFENKQMSYPRRQHILSSTSAESTQSLSISILDDGALQVSGIANSIQFTITSPDVLEAETSYSVELTALNGTLSLYINGLFAGSVELDGNIIFKDDLKFGSAGDDYPFWGSMDFSKMQVSVNGSDILNGQSGVVYQYITKGANNPGRRLFIQYNINTIFSQLYTGEIVPLYTSGEAI